jgi:serine protease Do
VSLLEVDPEDAEAAGLKEIRGAKVADFTDKDSPALKAGLEPGDIITAVDGKRVDQVNSLQRIIREYRVGQTAKVEVMRFGQRREFNIKLTSARPDTVISANADSDLSAEPVFDPKPVEKVGVTASTIPSSLVKDLKIPEDVRTGLIVRSVSQRGPAFQRLFPNDMIDAVIYPVRRDVKSIADLEQALAGLKSGQVVTFKLWTWDGRGGSTRTESIRIP